MVHGVVASTCTDEVGVEIEHALLTLMHAFVRVVLSMKPLVDIFFRRSLEVQMVRAAQLGTLVIISFLDIC